MVLEIKNSAKNRNHKSKEFVDTIIRDYTQPISELKAEIDEKQAIIEAQQKQIALMMKKEWKFKKKVTLPLE